MQVYLWCTKWFHVEITGLNRMQKAHPNLMQQIEISLVVTLSKCMLHCSCGLCELQVQCEDEVEEGFSASHHSWPFTLDSVQPLIQPPVEIQKLPRRSVLFYRS